MKKKNMISKLLCFLMLFFVYSITASATKGSNLRVSQMSKKDGQEKGSTLWVSQMSKKHGQEKGKQVYDQSGLMNEQQISAITEKADALREKYHMNFIIVTTDDAEGKSAMEYADDFYMDEGFYNNGEKGGATYLIDMDNRELWIGTGGDMKYYLTDERIERIIDAGYAYLTDGQYYECFDKLLEQTQIFIDQGVPSDQYTYDTETGKIVRYRSIRPEEMLIAMIIALAAGGIACAIVIGKYRLKWGTYKYPFKEKSKMTLTGKEDRFINQIVTTRHIPRNPPPSSGGGAGRSSTHTSSGGGSFGGGGRKF